MLKKTPKPRNPFELRVFKELKKARVKFKYEAERLPYVLARHYIPDFIIETPTGKLYIECKGFLRATDKSKIVAVRKYHPEIDLRMVFYDDRKKKDIKWTERKGIRYAIGSVPKEWLEGM